MAGNDVSIPVKFEDRVKNLLRENFGTMLTEEELLKIMTRGIEELLFKSPGPVHIGHNSPAKPPLITSFLLEEFRPAMQEAVRQWAEANKELVTATIQQVLGDNAADMLRNTISNMMTGPFENMRMQLHAALIQSNGKSAY